MTPTSRVRFEPAEGAERLFTPAFNEFLAALHDRLNARALKLRADRARLLADAHAGRRPAPLPPSEATTGDWKVPPVPDELKKTGIENSGPCSITSMFINALNPGPEGERAEGDLDDDEDSGGHRLVDTVRAAVNRLAAVSRELYFNDTERKREYKIAPGELPFFMHRERGMHLDEPDVRVDDTPVNAAILGTALTLFYAGRSQADRGQGVYFYLPKLETPDEARFYRELFDACRERLPFLSGATIRGIILVESLPCVYYMEEMLHALGPYAAGLNAARWDLKASIFEYVMTDPKSVWPDRFGVDIKTTPFLSDIFRRLFAIRPNGRGAKGIDSLEGKPGVHPALMEDLATGRMSVAQIAQRVLHHAPTTQGPPATHDVALVKRLLQGELDDILTRRPKDAATQERYRKAVKIAMRWIKNYTDLDFRSLGSYTRADLDRIAREPDAL